MADDPNLPIVRKVNLTPIQASLPAVNDDRTLTFALQGELNRMMQALANTANYNAETIEIIVETLKQYGILVQRVKDVEELQAKAVKEQALVNSYTDPTTVLTSSTPTGATTSTIVVANHKRVYADAAKTTVNVTGKTITGLDPDTYYYLYYDDANFAGGAVDIKFSKNNLDAAQTNNRHSLGSIATPAVGGQQQSGGGTTPPGGGGYRNTTPRLQEQ